jgi:hypothetical protein
MRDSKQQPETNRRVSMFLDRALSQEDESRFLQEAKHDPALQVALNQEQSFRQLIRNGVHRRKASTALIQSIKDKIRTAPH